MSEEWFWAGVIVAAPFVVLGLLEAFVALRRKRQEAIARRPKSRASSSR